MIGSAHSAHALPLLLQRLSCSNFNVIYVNKAIKAIVLLDVAGVALFAVSLVLYGTNRRL